MLDSYAVYIGILAFFTTMIYFYFPETKHLTIEEIAIKFDGNRALDVTDGRAHKEDVKGATNSETTVEHIEG